MKPPRQRTLERPVRFSCRGMTLVGMLHRPATARSRGPAVCLLHGHTGNRTEKHRLFVKLARALAAADCTVLRFDFRCCGDSAGEFEDLTIKGQVADARAALRWLRRQPGVDPARVGLLGFSLGGLVAAYVLGKDADLKAAVLWAAPAHPGRLPRAAAQPGEAEQLQTTQIVDRGGWAIGAAFIEEFQRARPLRSIRQCRAPLLLLHGQADDVVPVADARDYENTLTRLARPVRRQVIAGANHSFDALPWTRELIEQTVAWFKEHLVPPPKPAAKRARVKPAPGAITIH